MSIQLPKLPYSMHALEPYLSKETLEYHYGQHHKTYVDNLNKLLLGTKLEYKLLEEIIVSSKDAVFNNAAQIYNHSFYWNCLTPNREETPKGELLQAIKANFDSFANFKELFSLSSMTLFGSGWTWLIKDQNGKLSIVNTNNANTPITEGKIPLLTCDVWEHAYYIDYRNMRVNYVEAFWHIINWSFVENQLLAGK